MRRLVSTLAGLCALAAAATGSAAAQGTAAEYARAESLTVRLQRTVVDAVNQSGWIGRTDWLWYRKTTPRGTAYFTVDAEHSQRSPAFDQARLAEALTMALHRPVSPDSLPLTALAFSDDR